MADELAILFLDTNILLHFKPLREIDWKAIANAKAVRLALCSPVLDELDEKKSDPRTAERARAAIAQLKEIEAAQGQVRDGVTLVTMIDDEPFNGNRDAAVIQRVRDYGQQHPSERVAVVSDDYNMGLRCRAKGVQCVELDEQWRKPVEDEAVRKLRKTEQELRRVRDRLPDYRLVAKIITDEINPPAADVPVELAPRTKPAVDVAAKMREIREKYPRLARPTMPVKALADSQNILGMTGPSTQEIDRYNNDLDNFYLQCEAALNSENREAEAQARSFCFELWLENNGGAPGTDVEACVGFPDLVDVRQANEPLTNIVPFPSPPKHPRSYLEIMRDRMEPDLSLMDRHMRALGREIGPPPNVSDPRFAYEVDTEVQLTVRRIKHHHPLCLGAYRVAYADWNSVKPFEAWYRVHSNEIPKPVHGRILFRVSKSQETEQAIEGDQQ